MSFTIPEIKSPAEYAQIALIKRINRFEASLGPDEEMAVHLAGVDSAFQLNRIEPVASLLAFYGVDADGRRIEAYQSFGFVSLTMIAQPKLEGLPARRMGFDTPKAD